jgi:hypothetical protein
MFGGTARRAMMRVRFKIAPAPISRVSVLKTAVLNSTDDDANPTSLLDLMRNFGAIIDGTHQIDPASILSKIARRLLHPDVDACFWTNLRETAFFLDGLTLVCCSEDRSSVLETLLPALCVIFRGGDEHNVGGQLLATFQKAEFAACLQSYCDRRADDFPYVISHFHVLANLARLENSVIGEVFDSILSICSIDEEFCYLPLAESTRDEILRFHFPPLGLSTQISSDFLRSFVDFAISLDTYPKLTDDNADRVLTGLEALCCHYPSCCTPLYSCNCFDLCAILCNHANGEVLIGHVLASMRWFVRHEPAEIPWTTQEIQDLSGAIGGLGGDVRLYVFDMFRYFILHVPERRPDFVDPDFVAHVCEKMDEGLAYKSRIKAFKLLYVVFDTFWRGAPADQLRVLFEMAAGPLISCLDLGDPIALRRIVAIFKFFDEHEILSVEQRPDVFFFLWLLSWEEPDEDDPEDDPIREMRERYAWVDIEALDETVGGTEDFLD